MSVLPHVWNRPVCRAVSTVCLILVSLSLTHRASAETLQDHLAAHVQYLSQPKLQGRKSRSAGARLARHYIEKQFRSAGLIPWADTRNLELSFRLGVNVVGMAPGSDPKFAKEIVLLSAHYDHLGKNRKGRICPGAADNASGVAVLIEAARRFGPMRQRARRSVAFAAFDAEEQMLLGSFAFGCRTDVEQARIVAVVNVDMLGRDFFDAISNTVFVAGTEDYPLLQSQVREQGSEAGIRVLPFGSDLIGPRSDHVAFETRNIPCLFFSCGTFKDYHQSDDTAARLNYETLEKSARTILSTVETLANRDEIPRPAGVSCDPEELKSVHTVLSELCRDPIKDGIKTNDVHALFQLKERVEVLLQKGGYNSKTREALILEVARRLGRYFLPFGDENPPGEKDVPLSAVLPYLQHIYVSYHGQLIDAQKKLVAQILQHPPGLFHGVSEFNYGIYDIPAGDISVVPTATDRFALHALGNDFSLTVRSKALIWPFGGIQVSFSGSFATLDCEGGRQQLIDYCLLYAYSERTNQFHTAAVRNVLQAVKGGELQGEYNDWLRVHLQQGGDAGETEWLLRCLASNTAELASQALTAARNSRDPRVFEAVREMIRNRELRPDVRGQAIQVAQAHPEKATLLAFTEVLGDTNVVYKREYCPQFSPDYPLADRTTFLTLRPFLEQTLAQPANTISEAAIDALKKATKRDFGANAQAWKAFVEKRR